MYYRCTSWLRGKSCEASRQQIREQFLEPQIDQYMQALQMLEGWRERVQELLTSNHQTDNLEKRPDDLRGQLRRLNYQFEQGLIEEADVPAYERRAQRLIREINSIVIPNADHTIETGERLIAFSASWGKAERTLKHSILHEMFEAVYINTDTKCIVGVKPYAELVLLFRQTKMIERDYQFILENNETAQDSKNPERSYVQYGSDGHRGIVRPLNREYQPKTLVRLRSRRS